MDYLLSQLRILKKQKEYERLAGLQEGNADYNAELESMYTKVTADEVAKSYADKYNEAKKHYYY